MAARACVTIGFEASALSSPMIGRLFDRPEADRIDAILRFESVGLRAHAECGFHESGNAYAAVDVRFADTVSID